MVFRHHLKIYGILGEGCFGQVWKCEALNIDGNKGTTTVAVKTLKESASEKDKKDLIAELNVMKMLDPHPNVVRLLGCCTLGSEKGAYRTIFGSKTGFVCNQSFCISPLTLDIIGSLACAFGLQAKLFGAWLTKPILDPRIHDFFFMDAITFILIRIIITRAHLCDYGVCGEGETSRIPEKITSGALLWKPTRYATDGFLVKFLTLI